MLLSAVGAWWLSIEMDKARREEQALARLKAEANLIEVTFAHQFRGLPGTESFAVDPDATPPGPGWLRSLLGNAFFDKPGGIHFSGKYLSDEAAEGFYDLPDLQGLMIGTTEQPLSRKAVLAIASLKKLNSLDISHPHTDANNFAELQSLTELVTLNARSDGSLSAKSAAAFVDGKSKLKWLGLSVKEFEPGALEQLGKLRSLFQLDLGGATFVSKELESLQQTPLQVLILAGAHLDDECLRHIAAIPSLKSLTLRDVGLHAEGLGALATLPALERLVIEKTALDGDALQQLGGSKSLKRIALTEVTLNDDLHALSSIKSLEDVMIGKSDVSPAGLAALRSLPGLRKLNVRQATITEADLAILADFPSLRSLNIRPKNSKFTDAAMPYFAALPLEEFDLPLGITPASVPLILQMQSLKRLTLPQNFPYAATQAVIAGLPNCRVTGGTTRPPQPAKPK